MRTTTLALATLLTTINAQSTTLSSLYFDTSGVTGSVTATYFPSTDITPITTIIPTTSVPTGSVTASYLPSTNITPTTSVVPTGSSIVSSVSSTLSSLSFDTSGVTGSMSVMPTATGASSASVSVATTKNAQGKVGLEREVMGVAGLLAGLVALVA